MQQRAGVSLKGGVGQVGDRYEQHADQVADLVVQGKSAAGLLDQMAGGVRQGQGAEAAVQRKPEWWSDKKWNINIAGRVWKASNDDVRDLQMSLIRRGIRYSGC